MQTMVELQKGSGYTNGFGTNLVTTVVSVRTLLCALSVALIKQPKEKLETRAKAYSLRHKKKTVKASVILRNCPQNDGNDVKLPSETIRVSSKKDPVLYDSKRIGNIFTVESKKVLED
ncbi:hypothetical protein Tco_1304685 [Tanacetum coccineum]